MTSLIPAPTPGNPVAGLLRRLWTFIGSGQFACEAPGCGRAQVGLSRYCRRHTDEILHWERDKWMA